MKARSPSSTSALSPIDLIAPCGMNCGACYAHLRSRNQCPGCRASDRAKPITRLRCPIKTCTIRQKRGAATCAGCAQLPCAPLLRLDRRYRAKYGMSMLENLQVIASAGVARLVQQERTRRVCSKCSAALCVHKRFCLQCGHPWR